MTRMGFGCPCGHGWLLHDIEEHDGDGSDLCCVQGCNQVACPGSQNKIKVLSCEFVAHDANVEWP